MSNKIYYISISLTKEGIKESVSEFDFKKTKSGYTVNAQSSFGGQTTRVKTNDILNPDSMIRTDLYHIISRYTWCFEEDKNKARELLIKEIKQKANDQYEIASMLRKTINLTNP